MFWFLITMKLPGAAPSVIERFFKDPAIFYILQCVGKEVISKATAKPELFKSSKAYTNDELKILIIKALGKRYQSAADFSTDLLKLII